MVIHSISQKIEIAEDQYEHSCTIKDRATGHEVVIPAQLIRPLIESLFKAHLSLYGKPLDLMNDKITDD